MKYRRCPQSMATARAAQIVTLASYLRAGHLPDEGGVRAQPAKLMDLIGIACGEMAAIEASRNAEDRRG